MKVIDTSHSSFESLISQHKLYVDKTSFIYKLITGPDMVFFSRPRRFGKSLTVSTLDALFKGKRELFKGLAIDSDNYDWKPYPVIHIDFGTCGASDPESLEYWLNDKLDAIGNDHGFHDKSGVPSYLRFDHLIAALSRQQQAVVLIDEYDKVLSDNLFNPEVENLRTILSNFYQVIKSNGDKIRFAFITGVTKYAKLSVFSKMNNLKDCSMNEDFSGFCGYSQKELEDNFHEYIELGIKDTGLSREKYLEKLKDKYDGYRFHSSSEAVYNPVSIGNFFSDGGTEFNDYWIETGNMKLLMDVSKRVDFNIVTDLADPVAEEDLRSFDILELASSSIDVSHVKSLLLQTGYLTIKSKRTDDFGTDELFLDFPNTEVRKAFLLSLAGAYAENLTNASTTKSFINSIRKGMEEGETDEVIELLRSFFAGIPYSIQIRQEKYYQSLLACLFMILGLLTKCEVQTATGRIDATVSTRKHFYIIEFKLDSSADETLNQIKRKEYSLPYLKAKTNKIMHLLGISFGIEDGARNITGWKEEILNASSLK